VQIALAPYDSSRPLVIDPVIEYPHIDYASHLGGSGSDVACAITVDDAGYVYVSGWTYSPDLPGTETVYQPNASPKGDAFVMKLTPSADEVIYATYLGGQEFELEITTIQVDDEGSAYITGVTYSGDFPVTANAYQPDLAGNSDAFVSKLNADGSDLLYSTFFGGDEEEGTQSLALNERGEAIIGGFTGSLNLPVTSGAPQPVHDDAQAMDEDWDAFLAQFSRDGSELLFSTYLGGDGGEFLSAVAVDSTGRVYAAGLTTSSNFPTTSDAFKTERKGPADGFLSVIDVASGTVEYSTLIGGDEKDSLRSMHLASDGTLYLQGDTSSSSILGIPNPSYQTETGDIFVAKLRPGDLEPMFLTFVGGQDWDHADGITVDANGTVYVGGGSESADFPTSPDAFQPSHGGQEDGVLMKIDGETGELLYATYVGGTHSERIRGITLHTQGRLLATGFTESTDFPMMRASQPGFLGGDGDVFSFFSEGMDSFLVRLRTGDAYDTTGDGSADSFDLDRNGVDDAWSDNNDGRVNLWDLDENGVVEFSDTTGDGRPDSFDEDQDGTIDAWSTDGSGRINEWDEDGDGAPDAFDTDSDGIADRYDNESSGGSSGGGNSDPLLLLLLLATFALRKLSPDVS
jgi:hypothetical protein